MYWYCAIFFGVYTLVFTEMCVILQAKCSLIVSPLGDNKG